jgi:ERCC4-type nuclease
MFSRGSSVRETPHSENPKFLKPYILKPTPIPDGFVLVQDTAEQRPLFARIPSGLTIMAKSLDNGDYSIKGFEDVFAIERKANDLFTYCTTDQKNTKEKMQRFLQYEFVGLAIEIREVDVYQYQQFSGAHPESVRGALISFQIRYGVHVYFGNRETCARWILDCAIKFWNVKHEV